MFLGYNAAMTKESVFSEALAKSPAERAVFLDAACAGQPELRAAVEAMLASLDATVALPSSSSDTGFDATRTHKIVAADTEPTELYVPPPRDGGTGARAREIGMVIAGRYTIVAVIGEGGM